MINIPNWVLVVLLLCLARPLSACFSISLGLLDDLINSVRQLLECCVDRIRAVLAHNAPAGSPVEVLVGIFFGLISLPVNIADGEMLRRSLRLLWPEDVGATLLAVSIVLVSISVGLLLHTSQTWRGRVIPFLVAAGLIGTQCIVAARRSTELARVYAVDQQFAVPADDGAGVLSLDGPSQDADKAAATPRVQPMPDDGPGRLAGAVAFLLSLGSIAITWAALHYAGAALAWLPVGPILLVFAVPLAIFRVLSALRLKDRLDALIEVFFSVLLAIAGHLIEYLGRIYQFLKRLMPACWTSEAFEWKQQRQERQFAGQQVLMDQKATARLLDRARQIADQALTEMTEADFVTLAAERRRAIVTLSRAATEEWERQLPILAPLIVQSWSWPISRHKSFPRSVAAGNGDGASPQAAQRVDEGRASL